MISTLDNKMMPPAMITPSKPIMCECVLDGQLGGAGRGAFGDALTYLPELWAEVISLTGAKTVLDVGCGFGYSTRWFQQYGCDVLGLEGSELIIRDAVTDSVKLHDFREGKVKGDRLEYDLCWCSEFLEHVDQQYEPNIFDMFTRCRYVLMAAAWPGFKGHHHVNLQPSSYWIERFEKHGFCYSPDETERLRKLAKETNPDCYFQFSGLFFVRERDVEIEPVWTDIGGWLTPQQGEILQALADGRTVLDLGTHRGRSAVCMARTAKRITTIDHHHGDDETGHEETLNDFLANIKRHGCESKIEPIISDFDDLGNMLEERRFQLVFIDGQHDAESVERDTVIALHALAPGGAIVWHDWDYESVREGVEATGIPGDQIKVMEDMGVFVSGRYKVAVTFPHSSSAQPEAMKSGIWACSGEFADQVMFVDYQCGCLTHNFNNLLANCLNARDRGEVTHMAMIHSDIAADKGWVDILAEEMCRKRVAVISAVVAIKDPDDDRTSTAIGVRGKPWEYGGYIRLRNQPSMPETFTGDDVCKDDGSEVLLINTGCMLIDLSWPFWDDCDGSGTPFVFEVYNRMRRNEQGMRYAQFNPEDWLMSRALDARNIPYAATWRVKARHIGLKAWENRPQLLTPVGANSEVNGHQNA